MLYLGSGMTRLSLEDGLGPESRLRQFIEVVVFFGFIECKELSDFSISTDKNTAITKTDRPEPEWAVAN